MTLQLKSIEQGNLGIDAKIHMLDIQKLPVKSVVVYAERAEVKRYLQIDASAGNNCIVLNVYL